MDSQHATYLLSSQQLLIEKMALGATLDECLDAMCKLIECTIDKPLAKSSILLLEGNQLKHGAAPSLPDAYCKAIDGIIIGPEVGACGTAVYTKKQVIVSDIATDPLWVNYKDLALKHGLKACWSTPIISSKNKVLGSFAIYYSEVKSPDQSDLELITHFSHLSSLAIEKEQSTLRERALILDRENLTLKINRIATALSKHMGGAFFEELALGLVELSQREHVLIGTLDDEGVKQVTTIAYCLRGEITENITYSLEGTPCQTLIDQNMCVYPDQVQETFLKDAFLIDENIRSYVGKLLLDPKGKPIGIIAILDAKPICDPSIEDELIDVLNIFSVRAETELVRLRSDQRLYETQQKLALHLENTPLAVVQLDIQNRVIEWSGAAEKIFGFTREEVVGRSAMDLLFSQLSSHEIGVLLSSQAKTPESVCHHICKNGSNIVCEWFITPLLGDDQELGYAALVVDITLAKQQEKKMRQITKMNALGTLTGGIAHDFNNLLGIISGYSGLLSNLFMGDDKAEKYLAEIDHASDRGAQLTKKLLYLAKDLPADTTVINLNSVLKNMENMLSRVMTPSIKIDFDLDEQINNVNLDTSSLEDAILNICINAMHAMNEQGTLSIKTAQSILPNNILRAKSELKNGFYSVLSFTDIGCGMSNDEKGKIFDPFYTTKGKLGAGLGLSQVYSFMRQSGGWVDVQSGVDRGTTFTLYFPECLDDIKEIESSTITSISHAVQGRGCILVVDDEEAILAITSENLIQKGYDILTTSSPLEALDIIKNCDISLLLSDVIMPDMDGFELVKRARELKPDIKVQLVSGYSNRVSPSESDMLSKHMLYKPYKLEMLLQRIKDILAGKMI